MSFQQGLSGLNAASRNLDVIGHNIANANTVGMKSSRAEFSELVASAIGTAGGSNAGIGVTVGTVSQQFSQGNISITGNNLDVAINGSGFLQLSQPDGSTAYTRAGNLKLDDTGNLVTNDRAGVMGFPTDPDTGEVSSRTLIPMRLPTAQGIPARRTDSMTIELNLDARAVTAASATPPTPLTTYGTSMTVYDSQGLPAEVGVYFSKVANNQWNVYTSIDGSDPALSTPFTVRFDPASGALDTAATGAIPPLTVTTPNGSFPVDLHLDTTTQFGARFAVSDLQQNGRASGELTGITIEDSGVIQARYSNGETLAQGKLALVNFRNVQGLTPTGSGNWQASIDSGQPVLGEPGIGNFGLLRSGALEDSNVDLTAELVNMMTAQRSYQANAQTIKTQDQVMSTLVNLR